eukprot:594526-Pyramimonas_sp.AAC.1
MRRESISPEQEQESTGRLWKGFAKPDGQSVADMLPSGDVGSSDPALIYRQLFPLVVAPGDPVELNDTEAVVVLEGELIWVGK